MEMVKDLLLVYGRILTILPLLLLVALLMGKRSIGQVNVFDFLVMIILGVIVGVDIADPDISHIQAAVAVSSISLLQRVVSKWVIRSRKFGRLITFEPTAVIRNGTFLVGNLRRIRYSVDNILQMLREKEIFDLSDVELALVEANGKLTVHKKPSKSHVTVEDLGIAKMSGGVSYPVIVEGKIYPQVLGQINLTESWLKQQLNKKGITEIDSIFFASVNEKHELHVSMFNNITSSMPQIKH
jgi:uncharacterized membrane protein YcaP (DUF421 family)